MRLYNGVTHVAVINYNVTVTQLQTHFLLYDCSNDVFSANLIKV